MMNSASTATPDAEIRTAPLTSLTRRWSSTARQTFHVKRWTPPRITGRIIADRWISLGRKTQRTRGQSARAATVLTSTVHTSDDVVYPATTHLRATKMHAFQADVHDDSKRPPVIGGNTGRDLLTS